MGVFLTRELIFISIFNTKISITKPQDRDREQVPVLGAKLKRDWDRDQSSGPEMTGTVFNSTLLIHLSSYGDCYTGLEEAYYWSEPRPGPNVEG